MLKKVDIDIADVGVGIEPSEKELAVIMAMDTKEEKADFLCSEQNIKSFLLISDERFAL